MIWSMLLLCLALCGVSGAIAWRYAYRLGFKHGQAARIPFALVDELLDHRISCLGQDPSKAQFEVETSLGMG